ncbi:MAG: hypothetical protein ACK5LJ_07060 [Paracoccus sp. (in: a-proteobacteria)]
MECPECGGRGRVKGTINHGTVVLRYRHCPICNHRWKAWEEIDPTPIRKKRPKQLKQSDLFGQIEEHANE